MKTYIAVNEIHDRPDLTKPTRITKVGKPIQLDDASAKSLGDAIRQPTADERKIFDIDDEAAEKAAAKPAVKPAKTAKPAAKPAEGGADTPAGGGDDTSGMV